MDGFKIYGFPKLRLLLYVFYWILFIIPLEMMVVDSNGVTWTKVY